MTPERPKPLDRQQIRLLHLSHYFGWITLGAGLLVLVGWQFDLGFIKQPLPHFPSMNPLTALSFLLCGVSFLFLSKPGTKPSFLSSLPSIGISAGEILAGMVLLIGLLKLFSSFGGLHLPVDQLLFKGKLRAEAADHLPHDMTMQSAGCFILAGICLLTLNTSKKSHTAAAHYWALVIFGIALFSIVGYLYRVRPMNGTFSYIPMAAHTAVCFMIFSTGILLSQPDRGLIRELFSAHTGGLTARILLPVGILVPTLFGFLRMITYWKGLVPTEFGVALLVSSIISTFVIVIWYNAHLLNKRDEQKMSAEGTLLESEERFRLLVSGVKDYAIFMLDPSGYVMSWNEGAERIKGYRENEIVGRHMSVFYTELEIQEREPEHNLYRAYREGRFETEGLRVRKDGSVFWANIVFTAIYDAKGEILGFGKVTRDITEKRRSNEQIAYLARLIGDTSDAIFSTDSSFIIKSWNKAAENLFGYSQDEVKGKIAGDILRHQLTEKERTLIRQDLKTVGYWKGEVIYLKKDNSRLVILVTISAVRDTDGKEDGFVMVCRDFTERKGMEEQLRLFNEDLEQQVRRKTSELTGIFERITDAFIAVDKEFRYTYVNKKAGELVHHDPDSLIGKYIWEVFPDAVGSPTYHAFNKAMSEQQHLTNTDYYAPLNLWQENHFYPSPDGLSIFIRDITEQKNLEKKATDYKYALDQSLIVSIVDHQGIIRYVNNNFCKISGYSPEELIGHQHGIIGSDYHPPEFIERMWKTISKGNVWKGEFRNRTKDGSIYWVDMTIVPFLNEKDEPYEYIALDSDITERKKAGELLQQSYEEIRQLASHLQDIREEERGDIAREIHDELGQQLTSLKMDFSWINKRSSLQEDSQAKEKVSGIMGLLDTTIKTVRRIATDLRPSILDDLGLIAAIEWQGQEFQKRSGIPTEFISMMDEFNYSSAMAIGLFRICQESLTNVARHAQASKVCITLLEQSNGFIVLRIEDNGKGFEIRKIGDKKTLGLLGMKERTLMMGGEFRLVSNTGKGTTLLVTIPTGANLKE